jgi:hypothetical protein
MVDRGHVGHEVRGVLVAIPPPPLDWRLAESVLLHLRAVAFFLADIPQGDDVGALGYEPPTVEAAHEGAASRTWGVS